MPWLALGAALAAFVVMFAAASGPFIFDDIALIPGNHYVHDLAHWREWFARSLWDTNYDVAPDQHRTFWRPVVVASYALDWWWGSGAPQAFHLTNALLHALNAALTFQVLRGWTGKPGPALIGALIFAVHPAQTEAAAWIAGRTDVLALFGLLLATLGVRARHRPLRAALLQVSGLSIAFGSKEMAVIFPAFAALEVWSETRAPLDRAELARTLRVVLPYVGLAATFAIVHRLLAPGASATASPALLNRLGLILEAYGRYLALTLWPSDLTFGRALLEVQGSWAKLSAGYIVLGVAAWFASAGLYLRWRRSRPDVALALTAYMALLLPVSGIVWLGYAVLVSPRFLYVPMVAVGFGVGSLAALPVAQRLIPKLGLGLVVSALAVRASLRAADYSDAERFWRRELTSNPHYTPAQEHFVSRELQAGRPRAALELAHHFWTTSAAAGVPTSQRATLLVKLLGSALTLTRDVDRHSLAAIQRFARSLLEGHPERLTLPEAGIDVDISKDQRLIRQLANSERTLRIIAAEAAERLGDETAARADVEQALIDCQDCWTLLSTSALILARCGDTSRALTLAERALQLSPPGSLAGLVEMIQTGRAWQARARAQPSPINQAGFHVALGSYGRAHALARPALESPPDDPSGVYSLAQLAYQAGDVATAERLLRSRFSAEVAERGLQSLRASARWQDRPRSPEEWLPELPR